MTKMKITVERSRRKTLTLTVAKTGEALVRAPLSATDAQIEAFVKKHARWLKNRLAARKTLSLADGERVEFFGRKYVIAEGACRFEAETLYLPTENRENALRALLTAQAERVMREMTERLASRYGFSYRSVRISSAHTRWGSCSREGRIAYTFRCAFLPEEIAEYIALHELCHTRIPNHGAAFWQEVARYMPDYARRRKRLRTYEWCMNVL